MSESKHAGRVQTIIRMAEAMQPDLVALRRSLHRYPETGWLEMRTSAVIAARLRALGWEVLTGRAVCEDTARMGVPEESVIRAHAEAVMTQEGTPSEALTDEMKAGFTGVVGILRCGEGPVVAMRFDIDALGMVECPEWTHRPTREGFASRNEGMMHACGHDSHIATGLGVAAVLAALKDELRGTVKLLFQPGEEGARGARAMVAAGHLDDADYFLSSHVAPAGALDDGDFTPGTWGSLATAKYDVTFTGKAAHAGGFPENGRNALVAASQAVLGLYGIPRHSGGMTRVNVGRLVAGTGRNVIPDRATLQLEVRGETTEINRYMEENMKRICEGAAMMNGCEAALTCVGMAESQHSDQALIDLMTDVVRRDLPHIRVSSDRNSRNWGSEDVSVMMNRVQEHGGRATYMRMVTPMAGAQHTVTFDFDEAVLSRGVQVFSCGALALMEKPEETEA